MLGKFFLILGICSIKFFLGFYGYCDRNCPLEKDFGLRQDVEFINSIKENTQCFTVSGPNPGKPCIFPFKHNGKTFNGCDIDPDDRSKTWCSTKVDSRGNHITGQGEYGHCGNNCQTNQPLSKFNLHIYIDYKFY